jgi:hypothetical protein
VIETALVVLPHRLIWHEPSGRTWGSIPDSRDLWTILWDHRAELVGVAHTHPGGGTPRPSIEDLTTFAACEAGLGRRLFWWIASTDCCMKYQFRGPDRFDYVGDDDPVHSWLDELRARSSGGDP